MAARPPAAQDAGMADPARPGLGRNVYALATVSFLTDVSSEMIYPLLPVFLTTVLGANASFIGAIEGAAETTAALLKLASGGVVGGRRGEAEPAGAGGLRDRVGDAAPRRDRDERGPGAAHPRRRPRGEGDPQRAARRADRGVGRSEHPRSGVRFSSRGRSRGRRRRAVDRVRGADLAPRGAAHGVLAGRDPGRALGARGPLR